MPRPLSRGGKRVAPGGNGATRRHDHLPEWSGLAADGDPDFILDGATAARITHRTYLPVRRCPAGPPARRRRG